MIIMCERFSLLERQESKLFFVRQLVSPYVKVVIGLVGGAIMNVSRYGEPNSFNLKSDKLFIRRESLEM